MELKTKHLEKPTQVIVILQSTLPRVHGVYIYNAQDFYMHYYSSGEPGGARRIHEDLVDTFCRSEKNTWDYTKEEVMDSSRIEIISDMEAFYIEL